MITDDRFYQKGGPVIFYTGNEGAIELFCENTGFAREAGEKLNAKIIFMEHRYYGKSIPGKGSKFINRMEISKISNSELKNKVE